MADDQAASNKSAERYRQAADDALQQLNWCIGYLYGIRKQGLARALSRNRNHIRRTLLNRDEQPLPVTPRDDA